MFCPSRQTDIITEVLPLEGVSAFSDFNLKAWCMKFRCEFQSMAHSSPPPEALRWLTKHYDVS